MFILNFDGSIFAVENLDEAMNKALDLMYSNRRVPITDQEVRIMISQGGQVFDKYKYPMYVAIGDTLYDYGIYVLRESPGDEEDFYRNSEEESY